MRRSLKTLLLLAVAIPLTGCIVVPRGGGHYCYYHPYACR
jgi:starvation-inducible outer membrane lipoprotein